MKVSLVFPHQLYADHPAIRKDQPVYLIEDSLFFGDKHYLANFHGQKLMLHRASMRWFADHLRETGHSVTYLAYTEFGQLEKVFEKLVEDEVSEVDYVDPVDFMLEKRLSRLCEQHGIHAHVHSTPGFINSEEENQAFFSGKKRYFMADFYQYQRKRLGILVENDGETPVGGKWSFDEENRKKLPKKMVAELPGLSIPSENVYVEEARQYVHAHFPNHLGSTERLIYPISHEAASTWLDDFLVQRFANFGPYEDAIVPKHTFLYHSVLTPALNIGLLTPMQVVNAAVEYGQSNGVPLASLEGFIRQIIGWREYMRVTYQSEGVRMRTNNHWGHHRPMPVSLYEGTTGIEPIDDTIRRIHTYAYCHHIERLMVLGGFMFICRIDPKEIYKWFMELFIDAYDWVMVPNVYAMSQNSAGGIITTKPYFSGSNYVRKMSHYGKAPWCETWDGLYWQFIFDHSESLAKNPRWSMMVATGRRMKSEKRQQHQEAAAKFFAKLDRED
ncbi:MAG: cryptochrome/photolyase family protein [Bacteroidota bacterium]